VKVKDRATIHAPFENPEPVSAKPILKFEIPATGALFGCGVWIVGQFPIHKAARA
jgi:hypothetical protein